jgi:septation ring formation regulator EzrA
MADYAKLVKRLHKRIALTTAGSPLQDDLQDSADAIEELQGKLKELYHLTRDINKNEINAQIEWENLDNYLRAFRKYADKIAGVELPKPPKGVE